MAIGLLLLAGLGSGFIGYGAGLASLISYPALLFVGLPPVTANVSNTVALTFSAVGGLATAGPELVPQRARVIRFAIAGAIGGAAGAVLLLSTPSEAFEGLVPWLVAIASIALLVRPWLRRLRFDRVHEQHAGLFVLIAVIAIYGGYFGAAAGVFLLAVFGAVLADPYPQINALKAMVLGSANIAASVLFVFFAPVDWSAVIPLAIGALVGSAVSPPVVRRLPETPLRVAVGIAGLLLAVDLYLRR
ncbi:MAG: sulfite exporter TauE/SafE family protein [Propionibacteriaceae bacterium]